MSTRGQLWLGLFRSQVAELAARHASNFVAALLDGNRDDTLIGEILVKITDSIVRNRELRSEYVFSLVLELYYLMTDSGCRFGSDYLKHVSIQCQQLLERMASGNERSKYLCVGLIQKLLQIDSKVRFSGLTS